MISASPKGELPPANGRLSKPPRGNPPTGGRKRPPRNKMISTESGDPRVSGYASGSYDSHCSERQSSMETGRVSSGSPLHERNRRQQSGGAHEISCTRNNSKIERTSSFCYEVHERSSLDSVSSIEDSEGDIFRHNDPLSSPDYASPIESFRLSPTYSCAGAYKASEQRSGREESQKMGKSSSNHILINGRKNLTGTLAAAHRAETSKDNDRNYKGFASNHNSNSIHNGKIEGRFHQSSTENSSSEEQSYYSDGKCTTSLSSNTDYQVRVDVKRRDEGNSCNGRGSSYREAVDDLKKTDYCDPDGDVRRYSGRHHHKGEEGISSSPLNKLQEPKALPPSTQERGNRDQDKEDKNSHTICGATKGEAIGLKTRVLSTSLIPSCEKKLRQFVTSPLCAPGQNAVLHCVVERRRVGVNALTPEYCLYVDFGGSNERLLMAARKIIKSKTSHYTICANRKDLYSSSKHRPPTYVGKVREKDRWEERSTLTSGTLPATQRLRQELGVISYNFLSGPKFGNRRMQVAIPRVKHIVKGEGEGGSGESYGTTSVCNEGGGSTVRQWQPTDPKESLQTSFSKIRMDGSQNVAQVDELEVMHQRESRYDALSSCLVDFKSCATMASVKNFQLIHSFPENPKHREYYFSGGEGKLRGELDSDDVPRPVILLVGKIGKAHFNLDFMRPLSMLQAFGIFLSRVDTDAEY